MEKILLVEEADGILFARMNRVKNRNAIDADMKMALHGVSRRFSEDASLGCLVITGSDDVFCAGGDLNGMTSDRRTIAVRERLSATHAMAKVLAACEKPVVTAINGAAVGAGLSLALLGDLVIASDKAVFMSGFPKVGVLPDLGILLTLPRAVGVPRAKDMLMTNRRLDAFEALQAGLVSRVIPHDEFEAHVREIALELVRGPRISTGLTKALIDASHGEDLHGYLVKETLAQAVVFGTDDFVEGVEAFRSKRRPDFKGR